VRADRESAVEVDWTKRSYAPPLTLGTQPSESAFERRILALPEGSLYAAGGMVFFSDREVLDAARLLRAKGHDVSEFESRAAIVRCAKNDYSQDDLAGYYEDFPR
jgi:hypothetical protein